jgi:small acid-soluble spore protein D (minor alpha/beta-type SASP)
MRFSKRILLAFLTKNTCLSDIIFHILSLNKTTPQQKHKRRGTYDQRGVCSDFNTKDTLKQMMYHNTPKEETIMASRSSNRAAVPEAKSALDRFKYEVASEIGVPLKDGYNGDLTSRQNGSVGGYMVKKMIEAQEKQMSGK